MRKVIAKIDLEKIQDNAKAFSLYAKKPICAVVKANAYGHGAEEIVNALSGIADCFAVSLLCEALAIRLVACGKDVLILTPPSTDNDVITSAKNGFVLTVGDFETAVRLQSLAEKYLLPIRAHLKVNTGMNRYGMDKSELEKTCAFLSTRKGVQVEGLYSHLYDYTYVSAERQRKMFLQMQTLALSYFPNLTAHLSATYGAMLGEDFFFDMIRVGIGLYGYIPDGAQDIPESVIRRLSLQKAMSVWAEVSASRVYEKGGVGYGKASVGKGTALSVLRYGYADGFLRKKDNGVCGCENHANNLCMDACVQVGKREKGEFLPVLIDAYETAKATGTISYEVLCAATRRAEMVYDDVTFCGR